MQQATVECPPGRTIGTVQQRYRHFENKHHCYFIDFSNLHRGGSGMNYVLKDANDAPMLYIMGPCCMCNGNYSCGCENKYTVSKFLFDKFYLKR